MSSSGEKPTISSKNNGNVFVTVGTTQFDKLVTAVTSKIALEWMVSCGYKKLIIQYGTGKSPSIDAGELPISIEAYDFLPSLEKDMQKAALILSHAGAGTVMEALRLQLAVTVLYCERFKIVAVFAGMPHIIFGIFSVRLYISQHS